MSLRRKSLDGFLWAAVEKFGNRFLTVGIFFTLANILDTEAFGLVALVNSFLAFALIFIEQGFTMAIVQRKELDELDLNSAFWGSLVLGIIFCLACFFGAPFIADYYEDQRLIPLLQVMSFSFPIGVFAGVQNALFQRELEFKVLAMRQLVATFIGGAVGIWAALNDYGVWSLIIYFLVTEVIWVALLYIRCEWKPGWGFSWAKYKSLFAFGANVMGSKFLFFSDSYFINLMIGKFLGMEMLGIYSFGEKIFVSLKDLLVNTISRVTLPIFAKLQENKKELSETFSVMVGKVSMLTFPLCAGFAAISEDITFLFFDPQWEPAIPVMIILSIATIFTLIPSYCNDLFLGVGRAFLSFNFNLVNSIVNLGLFFAFVQFGIVGVAVGFLLRMVVFSPIGLYLVSRLIPLNVPKLTSELMKGLLASALVFGVAFGLKYVQTDINYFWMGLKIVAGGGVFIGALAFLQPETFEEVKRIFFEKVLGREKLDKKREINSI
ncbi:MAG: lipopolysaccharide biosynthesis protein [Bacteroidota bacterium]